MKVSGNDNWIKNAPSSSTISNTNANNWIKNAPTVVGQNFKNWFKNLVFTNKLKFRSKNNISAIVKSARAKAGLELYDKFKGYYINAHGFCLANSSKFIIPKDKAVLFVGKAGEMILNKEAGNLEQTLLRNNGRIKAFIQGSTSFLNLKYGNYKGRLYLPGEEIYEHYLHFTRDVTRPVLNTNINNQNLLKFARVEMTSLGPSFGHIWKLPLPVGYSSLRPFSFSNNKNKILWNLPTLLSRSTNAVNNAARYTMRRQLQKLSTILRQGPPGVYIVGTCRQDVFQNKNSVIKNYSNVFNSRGMKTVSSNMYSQFFNKVKSQNTVNSTYVPRIRNTSNLRKLSY